MRMSHKSGQNKSVTIVVEEEPFVAENPKVVVDDFY